MQERLSRYDIMKAIGIYLVVVGHLLNRMSYDKSGIIFFLHMPLFFFVSGYFSERSLEKYEIWVFCKKKMVSLVIPYIIWSGISLLANTLSAFIGGQISSEWLLNESVDIFLYARSVWFLIALFFSHVLYAFIREFCRRLKMGKATVVCYFVLWIVASSILPDHILAFYKVKWLFPFMIFGGIAANIKKVFRAEKWQVFAGTVVFILASVFLYEEKMAAVYSEFLYTNLPEIAIGVVYYAISSLGIWCLYEWSGYIAKIDQLKEKMCMVGRRSIDIYVTHMLVIKFFFFIPRLIRQSKIMIVLYACIYAFVVVACIAVVSDKYLKNINVYNLAVGAKKESAGENIRIERRTLL